jgi:hypothetical protein
MCTIPGSFRPLLLAEWWDCQVPDRSRWSRSRTQITNESNTHKEVWQYLYMVLPSFKISVQLFAVHINWAFTNFGESRQNLKKAVLWDAPPCGSRKNLRFGSTYCLRYQDEKNQRARSNICSNYSVLVTVNLLSLLILFTLMMEAISSSETSVLTRAILRYILKVNSSSSPFQL